MHLFISWVTFFSHSECIECSLYREKTGSHVQTLFFVFLGQMYKPFLASALHENAQAIHEIVFRKAQ